MLGTGDIIMNEEHTVEQRSRRVNNTLFTKSVISVIIE